MGRRKQTCSTQVTAVANRFGARLQSGFHCRHGARQINDTLACHSLGQLEIHDLHLRRFDRRIGGSNGTGTGESLYYADGLSGRRDGFAFSAQPRQQLIRNVSQEKGIELLALIRPLDPIVSLFDG